MLEVPASLLRTLTALRWIAVVGQGLTVFVVINLLKIPFDPVPLWASIAALAAFNCWASWRATRALRVYAGEILAHIAVDVATLAWLIANTGGAMNPFGSLFLLPIVLVAVALPAGWIALTAALCSFGYGASTAFGEPLPHVHGVFGDALDLHLFGMTANFAVSAIVVVCFVAWLSQNLRRREKELADLKEQFTRNEGILALATHAASVAHELNTPIATLTLMLEEKLDLGGPDDPLREDLELMRTLVNACRDRVRELAAPASGRRYAAGDIAAELDQMVDRWRLLRPEVHLTRTGYVPQGLSGRLDIGICHLLQALLNNAADSSAKDNAGSVELDLRVADNRLVGAVRDYGAGFENSTPILPGTLFQTTKPDGLGVGLALSHATVERLGGTLSMEAAADVGVIVRFSLPLDGKE